MKLSTKILTGMSVAALSVVLAGGVKADAAAGTWSAGKSVTIAAKDLVSFDAVKVSKTGLSWNAKAKWDVYYSTTLDLSNVNTAKKDAYIAVKTGSSIEVFKIEKDTLTKYKGSITASKLTITENGKDTVDATGDNKAKLANYEYRTEAGAWTSLTSGTEIDVKPYEQNGATLYFRHRAATSISGKTPENAITIKDAPTGTSVKVIGADSFPGKEFKVKVPKMANAPAITIDYNTGVVKAKKGAEYRVATSEFGDIGTTEGAWKDSVDVTLDTSQAGYFQMRVKATDKKAASKIAPYYWSKVDAPSVTANSVGDKADIIKSSDNKVELTSTSPQADTKAKATFTLKNETTDKTIALYKVKTDSNNKIVADGKAVATLKPGKSVTLKDAKVADQTELAAMYVGDKKTDKLPSGFSSTKMKVLYNVKASS